MAEAGRPTELTKETLENIKQGILDGKTLKEIAEHSKINEGTLYQWHSKNYSSLADKVEGWKRDRKVNLATSNLEEMLTMQTINKEVIKLGYGDDAVHDWQDFQDPALIRIKADMTKFTLETLAKETYSKRSEMTGAEGKDLFEGLTEEQKKKLDNLL